jgi:rare lipoprotein A
MDDWAWRRGWTTRAAVLAAAAGVLSACAEGPRPEVAERNWGSGTDRPYQVNGVWYYPRAQPDYDEIGVASWYGPQFQSRRTADGEMFDMNLPSAAHKTLPLPCLVEVTNLANGRRVVVRVNDRGPFVGGRVIDLSRAAANDLGFVASGVTRVRVRYVGQAEETPARSHPLAKQYQAAAPRAPAAAPLATPMTVAALQPPPVTLEPNPSESTSAPPPVPPATAPPPAMMASIPADSAPVGAMPAAPERVLASGSAAVPAPPMPAPSPPPLAIAPPALLAQAPAAPVVQPVAPPPVAAPPAPLAVAQASVGHYQVQAGAFGTAARAQQIAAALSGVGQAQVLPFEHSGRTLYRVVVRGLANPAAAEAARSRAATLGLADARVSASGA